MRFVPGLSWKMRTGNCLQSLQHRLYCAPYSSTLVLILDHVAAGDKELYMRNSALALSSDLNANPQPLEITRDLKEEAISAELQRRISEKAYNLFQSSGSVPGHELAHWLQAENELLNRTPEVRESGPWVVVNLHLPLVPAESLRVFVGATRGLVAIEDSAIQHARAERRNLALAPYYVADWPANVDPATASAYLKSGMLTLEVKLSPACAAPPEKKRAAATS